MSVGKHAAGRRPLGKLALLLALAMVVSAFAVGPLAGAAASKVDVCHWDADAGVYFKINISENAFQSHVDNHGDASPGEEVPGNTGYEFGDDCTVDFVPVPITSVAVPGNTATPTPGPVLASGTQYKLEVSGTYRFGGWTDASYPDLGLADAQCSMRPAGVSNPNPIPAWINGDDLPASVANWLEVNYGDGTAINWSPGTCQASHEYSTTVTGDGTAISFVIRDDHYSDNTVGNILVVITQMTP